MTPYLTFIASSRNDDHGKDMRKRMAIFVRGLLAQSRRFNVPMELILVDWNPPAGKPPLCEALPAPQKGDRLTIRYITVPNELHRRYKHGDTIPLFQMIAKNVGIRRAKGEYIVCTNVDLLFSDPLMKVIEQRGFRPDSYYRCQRVDIPAEIDENAAFEAQLEYCKNNILRRAGKYPHLLNIDVMSPPLEKIPGLAWALNTASGIKRSLLDDPDWTKTNQADTDACGDFTLMHRDAWLDIQGYAEMDLYSIHIDSMGLFSALARGYKQVVLPPDCCAYHIDHEVGWASMDDLAKVRFLAKRPGMDGFLARGAGYLLIKNKQRWDINAPDWGFANENLPEVVLTPEP